MTTKYSKITTSDDYSPVIFDKKYANEASEIRFTRLYGAVVDRINRDKATLPTITDPGQIALHTALYDHAQTLCYAVLNRYYRSSSECKKYGSEVFARIILALDNPGDPENAKQLATLAKNVPGTSAKDLHLAAMVSYFAVALAVVVICITFIPSGGISILGIYGALALVLVGEELRIAGDEKNKFQNDTTSFVNTTGFFSPKEGVTVSAVEERNRNIEASNGVDESVVGNAQL